jgi:hypothetical protein
MAKGDEAVDAQHPRRLTLCFDIDGTLCDTPGTNYAAAIAIPGAVAGVNRLYDTGNRIVLFSARGAMSGVDWRDLTERQLREWGVRYHELLLGKPPADVYIDDRAISASDWKTSGYRIAASLGADA